ncbi:MAG: phenylalanine 4-monooxygenase [Gemmatimonadales bacterium]
MSSPAAVRAPSGPSRLRQRWTAYRPEDHAVWAELYRRRMADLPDQASAVFLAGVDAIGLEPDRVPDLARINERLAGRTGWRSVPVPGFLPAPAFFASLARRRFPTVITVRQASAIDYTPAPDIFHDIFGHVPLHADPVFAGLLQRFGRLALAARSPAAIEQVARLFWFTIEFGLVRESGAVRLYGSGLISSAAEAAHALGPHCARRPFDLDTVLGTSFDIDHVQPLLFVIEDFAQLFEAMDAAAEIVKKT